jgi:DNA-binding CsgD family transcriptional regulator
VGILVVVMLEDQVSPLRPQIDVSGAACGLVGRESELGVLVGWLGGVRERGAGLVVRGGAGVGKSALLAATVDRAVGERVRVLAVSGIRSEAGVGFAGLHQMVGPLLEQARELPGPQRDALLATFGMNEGWTSDTFVVALAALELLNREAEHGPLVVVVDDAHWLDRQTADVLGLVGRRLSSTPAGLLLAVRDGYETALLHFGLPELRIEAMDEQPSSVLLDSIAPGLGFELRGRVLAAAAGNPLALIELPKAVGSGAPVAFGVPERLPMTARLEHAMVERFCDLPAATRTVLLVGSADAQASLNEVLTAAGQLGEGVPVSLDDLAPAVASCLVDHDHRRIRFRPPVVAAAIYQAASLGQRHRAHSALATALIDRPRRAWHRAASTTSPDEVVAAELEWASTEATARGSPTITLSAMERAAELTPDVSRRRHRLLRGAELAAELGQLNRAEALIGAIDPADCDPLERARVGLVRDMIEPRFPVQPTAVNSLVEAATRASSAGEIDLALRLLQAAAMQSWWANPRSEACHLIAAALQHVAAPEDDPRVLSILGFCDPAGRGSILSEIFSRIAPHTCDPVIASSVGAALHATGAFEISTTFLTAAVAGLRQQGRLWLLPQALAQQAWNAIYTGNWSLAASAAEEAASLARDTRQALWEAAAKTVQSMIAAIRGDQAGAESRLREAEGMALPLGASAILADIQLARALLALGDGRYEEAFQHLQRTFEPHDPAHHPVRSFWRIGDYAEASLRAGHVDQARQQLARSESLGRQAPSGRLQVGLLYARPLLADGDTAEAHFRAALAANLTSWPLYRVRLLLEYGTWLRHRRRIAAARMPLRAARDAFEALGARPWAERARRELRASREAQRRQPAAGIQLTEQEQQIAHLAAEGLSNREIAQRLYMSHRTVGAHLYRIFPKLGITSRTQLPGALRSPPAPSLAS